MSVGLALQTYSLGALAEQDPLGAIERAAEIGYDRVELDALHGAEPEAIGARLVRCGVSCCGLHVPLEYVEDHPERVAASCRGVGTSRAVVSFVGRPDSWEEAIGLRGRLDAAAADLAHAGVSLSYHTHDWEFKPWSCGRTPLEAVLSARRALVEPDLGWAWQAGERPVGLLGRLQGRCPVAHLRDFRVRGDRGSSCAVGEGGVGTREVLLRAGGLGVEVLVVEFDAGAGDALEAARRSLRSARAVLREALSG